MPITTQLFGKTDENEPIDLFTLTNKNAIETSITNYGGRIVTLKIPDRNGDLADVVLGFDNLDGYLAKNPYFGALVGRFANRIANARFQLNGTTYNVPRNSGNNSLHGGFKGFDKVAWKAAALDSADGPVLELKHFSKDGDEGYPGNLNVLVRYTLTNENELKLDYESICDQDTVLNLTNHSYFDLSGQNNGNILDHLATINADRFTPANEEQIPTGELRSVAGTAFDFRQPTRIGDRIDADEEQIKLGLGYDHNFVLNGAENDLSLAAKIVEPVSGRVMEVFTTMPGMQFYTGNHLTGSVTGKGGVVYKFRFGFCVETQQFPDAPNQPNFPSSVLKADEKFHSTTVFKFSTVATK